jgi:N-methylhydantoinase A
VTDANLLLGRLQATRFLGGDFTLDLDRTRGLTEEWLKKQNSNLTLERFAAGVIRVVNAVMEKAIRVVSIERGRDPRQLALVAFGGAGGLHACALADALSIPRVIIPTFPGGLSALGILASDVVKDYSRTVLWRVSNKIPLADLQREFAAMQKTAKKDFAQASWQGRPRYFGSIDLRYLGQGYELNLPFTKNLLDDFQREHHRRYGYKHDDREIELVTLRLRATLESGGRGVGDRYVKKAALGRSGRAKLGRVSPPEAKVLFDSKIPKTKIYSRDELQPSQRYSGPTVVTEYGATTVIPPGKRFHLDQAGNLIVTIQ